MKANENSLRYLGTILAALLISGCSTMGPSYETAKSSFPTLEPTKTRLFFLRESTIMGAAVAAQIHVNGIKVADLYNGGFSYIDSPSGDAFIMIDQFTNIGEWKATAKFDAGKEYYFIIRPNEQRVMAAVLFGMMGAVSQGGGPFQADAIPIEMAKSILPTLKHSKNDP